MKFIKWILGLIALAAIGCLLFVWLGLPLLNSYQMDGELKLKGLQADVTIVRDAKGMPYVQAKNLHDLIMGQGFAAAQDRIFGMDMLRRFATGRLSEVLGPKTLGLDMRQRTLGFGRNAKKWAAMLDQRNRDYLQAYTDGVNAFIEQCGNDLPLEFKLLGYKPEPWTIEDTMAATLLMSWQSSANMRSEIVALALQEKLGPEAAKALYPININPDDPDPALALDDAMPPIMAKGGKALSSDPQLRRMLERGRLEVGSNNWVVGPSRSPGGKPIVVNDPHLKANVLPGPWWPCGLISPDVRAVGISIPGIPGMVSGRTSHIAIGVTNAYGDAQDLYIETIDPKDPGRYMEGDQSVAFTIIKDTVRVKDPDAPGGFTGHELQIRLTKRGPIISRMFPGLPPKTAVSVRWAAYETFSPTIALGDLLLAKDARQVSDAIGQDTYLCLNFVFADTQGNIGWRVGGRLPIRSRGDGTMPLRVDGSGDNWVGVVPAAEMPQAMNPQKGWLGTSNHYTVERDYQHYYTSHASPSWRYRRMSEVINSKPKMSVDDHWALMLDTKNMMAARLAPIMAKALAGSDDTKAMADVLAKWDFFDRADSAAAMVFQSVYRQFAYNTFAEKLGPELTWLMLNNMYWWQERLALMVTKGQSPWFGDGGMDELFRKSAQEVLAELGPKLGNDPAKWQWGELHRLIFVSPLRREGAGRDLLGGGNFAYPGSQETLLRAIYTYSKPYETDVIASLRMVADLSDSEKVEAVLPGGVTGRQFSPHFHDQVPVFVDGGKDYWWFSDKAIADHAQHELLLKAE